VAIRQQAPRLRGRRRPRRSRPRSTETRLRIVEAALHAFGDCGFDGALTRDIAAAAGVQQPLINYHFGSKEGLWQASVAHLFARLESSVAEALPRLSSSDPRETLAAVLRHFVHFNAEHPELVRLMIKESAERSPRLEWIVSRHVRPSFEAVLSLIRQTQARGSLSGIEPASAYYLFMGAATSLFVMAPAYRLLTGQDPFSPERRAAHADSLVRLFLPERTTRGSADGLPAALRLDHNGN
jgi:TetR/AcrR family transcriptional regulator